MSDLDVMKEFRADLAPATSQALRQARARMFADARPAQPPRARPGWTWRMAPVAVVAIIAAVVGVSVHEQVSPGASADARSVLHLAAAEAGQQTPLPARPDQFVYVDSAVQPPAGKDRKIWVSVDGTREGLLRESPDNNNSSGPLPVGRDPRVVVHDAPGDPQQEPLAGYARNLPTEPAAMRDYLYRHAAGGKSADQRAFTLVGDLLGEHYVPPAAAAAMFEATASVPGVTVVRGVTDAAGRTGIAVSRTDDGIRQDLIFDPASYRYLGVRTVMAGTSEVLSASAQTKVAIVNQAGQMP